jgi:acetylornithine deacetylase/succinyl-diaminopimelate desuccinylase-like protein
MDVSEVKESTRAIMPEIMDELRVLVSHASCAFPGFPPEPVHAARAQVVRMLANAGFEATELDLGGGGYPAVWGEIPPPPGAPTVLLYAHYDVQPAPMEQGWETDPWTPTMKDGRLYGRGASDDKSGVAIHAGTLRVFGGKPPVGVKVIMEGEEETLSHLEEFVEKNPDRFKSDCMIIADMGNIECGRPVLTTMLRGHCQCIVEVRTVDHPLHSGVFGGPVPDAFVALIRLLNSLWDDRGNTIVPGLEGFEWPGADYPEPLLREMSAMLPGVQITGDGSVGSKLWSKPNATVIGIDGVPVIAEAGNVLLPVARAKVALRIAPGADPETELAKLMDYLRAAAPWGVVVDVKRVKASDAFVAPQGGPAMAAAAEALEAAYGVPPSEVGSGGSIPLLETLMKASPDAEFILLGAEDAKANIHGANESVHPDEIERMIVAQALLIQKLADRSLG